MAETFRESGRKFLPDNMNFTTLLNSIAQSGAVKTGGDDGGAGHQAKKILSVFPRLSQRWPLKCSNYTCPYTSKVHYNSSLNCGT